MRKGFIAIFLFKTELLLLLLATLSVPNKLASKCKFVRPIPNLSSGWQYHIRLTLDEPVHQCVNDTNATILMIF